MIPAPTESPLRFPPAIAAKLAASAHPIVITGATGWLGQALLEMCAEALGDGFASRVYAFASSARPLSLRFGRVVNCRALRELSSLAISAPLVFHFACLTKDKQQGMTPETYLQTNRGIAAAVAQACEALRPAGICITSSGAVYQKSGDQYGQYKLEEEALFSAFSRTLGCPLVVPRIFNISGPYINKWNAYALASLSAMALAGEALEIKARHAVIRSYVAVQDVLALCMALLLEGKSARFDTAAAEAVEIGELAEAVCAVLDASKSSIVRTRDAGLPEDRYVGDGSLFLAECARYGIVLSPLAEQIHATAAFIAPRAACRARTG